MLRKANAGDRSVVTGILARSFADNLSVNLIAAGSSQEKRVLALMEYAFEVCSLFGEVFITADGKGCALVLYPDQKKTGFRSVMLDIRLIFNCVGLSKVLKVMKRESAVHDLQVPGKKAYLWFIGVNPIYQHNGIGTRLLSEVIAHCEKQGRFMVLETSTLRNIPWYKSFGFSTYATLDLGYKLFFLKKDLPGKC